MLVTRLRFIRGENPGIVVELRGSRCVIGRASVCDLQLKGTAVSRRHCLLTVEGETAFLQDSSTGGTVVNGARIREAYLEEGDRIRIGEYELEVVEIPGRNLAYQVRGLLFGKLAVQMGLVEQSVVEAALRRQAELREAGQDRGIGDVLVEQGAISTGQRELLIEMQSAGGLSEKEINIGMLAVRNRVIDRKELTHCRQVQREMADQGQARSLVRIMLDAGYIGESDRDALMMLHDREAARAGGSCGVYRTCGACGEIVGQGMHVCTACGAFLGRFELQKLCGSCSELFDEKMGQCPHCEESTRSDPQPPTNQACLFCGGTMISGQQACPQCGTLTGSRRPKRRRVQGLDWPAAFLGVPAWAWLLAAVSLAGLVLWMCAPSGAVGVGRDDLLRRQSALLEAYRKERREAILDYVQIADRGARPAALWDRMLGAKRPDELVSFKIESVDVTGGRGTCYVNLIWRVRRTMVQHCTISWQRSSGGWVLALPEETK